MPTYRFLIYREPIVRSVVVGATDDEQARKVGKAMMGPTDLKVEGWRDDELVFQVMPKGSSASVT